MLQVEKLLVFLASPGDVPTERRYVEETITDLNRTVASDKGVVLQVVNWENDAFPGYGQDAQALINSQIAEMAKHALFVGIMWNRLGTLTPRAASGTVEEFERAVEAFKHNEQPDIWFYFRQSASKQDTEEESEQRKKVLAFQKQVQANGMPWTYKNPTDFRNKFRRQMILWLNARTRGDRLEPVKPRESPRLELWPINGVITGNYNLQRGGSGLFYIRLEFMIRSNVQQTIRTLKVQYFEGRSDDPYGHFAQRVKIDNEEWVFSGDDNLVPPLDCKPLQRYTFWYWAELCGHDTVVGPEGTDYGRGRLRIGATGSELETYFYLNPGGEMLLSEDGWIGPQKYYST